MTVRERPPWMRLFDASRSWSQTVAMMRIGFLLVAVIACAAAPGAARPPAAMRSMLEAHNARRAEHCAPKLGGSNDLERTARRWADQLARKCTLQHSGNRRVGENLAAGTKGSLTPEAVTTMWYEEAKDFDFARGGFSMETGHFTQLVWVGTKRLGCAKSSCRDI